MIEHAGKTQGNADIVQTVSLIETFASDHSQIRAAKFLTLRTHCMVIHVE